MKLKINKFKTNRIIKYLILSDLAFWTGWGFIIPILAVFVVQNIKGGSIFIAGMAEAVYWISRSLFNIPVGMFLDKRPSEKDDYFFMVFGLLIASLVPFGYVFAKTPFHVYFLQGFLGLGMAMSLSAWSAVFTRHIDRGRESTEWALSSTSIGLGMGIAGALGGWLAYSFGFKIVFIIFGVLGLLGVLLLFGLRKDIEGVFDRGKLKDGFYAYFKSIFQN